MTVVAWDGRYLAADRRMLFGTEICQRPVTKIAIEGKIVAAGTGYIHGNLFDVLIRMYRADSDGLHHFDWSKEPGNFIVCRRADGTAGVWSHWDKYGHVEQAPAAWGTAGDYATGAMHAGANAMEACDIACKLDSSCGGGVQFIDTHFPEKGVQTWDGVMPTRKCPMPIAESGEDPFPWAIICAKFDGGTRHDPRCSCPDAPHNL